MKLIPDDQTVSENDEIADIFNKPIFCSNGHNFRSVLVKMLNFCIPKMTKSFILKEISGMCTAKATGLDNISVKLLKLTSSDIVAVLIFILNFSIDTNLTGKMPGLLLYSNQAMNIL